LKFERLKFDKVEISGLVVLFVGVSLLAATFYSAFMFLVGDITILTSVDLAELFGNALAPLIKAIIHILYLGIMGWVGSILTIRAVQLLKKEKAPLTQSQTKSQTRGNMASPTSPNPPKPDMQEEAKELKKAENPEQTAALKQQAEPQSEARIEKTPEKPAAS